MHSCAKRLRHSERESAVEHAHLHAELACYTDLKMKHAAELVDVPVDVEDDQQQPSGAYDR